MAAPGGKSSADPRGRPPAPDQPRGSRVLGPQPKYLPEVYRLAVFLRWFGMTYGAISRQLARNGTPLSDRLVGVWVRRLDREAAESVTWHKYPEEVYRRALDLRREGLTVTGVAAQLERDGTPLTRTHVGALLRAAGLMPPPPPRLTEAQREEIARLHCEGRRQADLARAYGVHASTVQMICVQRGAALPGVPRVRPAVAESVRRAGKPCRPYSPSDDDFMTELAMLGVPLSAIAAHLGRRPPSVSRRLLRLAYWEELAISDGGF